MTAGDNTAQVNGLSQLNSTQQEEAEQQKRGQAWISDWELKVDQMANPSLSQSDAQQKAVNVSSNMGGIEAMVNCNASNSNARNYFV